MTEIRLTKDVAPAIYPDDPSKGDYSMGSASLTICGDGSICCGYQNLTDCCDKNLGVHINSIGQIVSSSSSTISSSALSTMQSINNIPSGTVAITTSALISTETSGGSTFETFLGFTTIYGTTSTTSTVASSSASNYNSSNSASGQGLSTGAKAGIGVGVAIGGAILLFGAAYFFWRKRQVDQPNGPAVPELADKHTSENPAAEAGGVSRSELADSRVDTRATARELHSTPVSELPGSTKARLPLQH
jgi:hypothetical protein